MEIKVNNEIIQLEPNSTVYLLLKQLRGDKLNGLAVALNEKVIPRSLWEKTPLNQNDNLLIIQATQGG